MKRNRSWRTIFLIWHRMSLLSLIIVIYFTIFYYGHLGWSHFITTVLGIAFGVVLMNLIKLLNRDY